MNTEHETVTVTVTPAPPPGWYPDATGRTRWWSGTEWADIPQPIPEGPPATPVTPRLIPEEVIAQRKRLAKIWWVVCAASFTLLFVLGWIGPGFYPDTDGIEDNGNANIPAALTVAIGLLSLLWVCALIVAWVYSHGARANERAHREAQKRLANSAPRLPRRTNHILHAILTILTGGFWLIIWLAVWLSNRGV